MREFLQTTSALNDETRVKILKYIDSNGETCVCDIECSFDMIQSRVSRHLKILKDAGLLLLRREGRWAHYSISPDISSLQKALLDEIRELDIQMPTPQKGCNIAK